MSIDVLTVSSKGQVVLPAEMRRKLAIQNGAKLAAYATDDMILLKVIQLPTEDDFAERLDEAQRWAASVGYAESDVDEVIRSVRKQKRQ